MPEGPEVRCIAESLNKDLLGSSILKIQWTEKSRYRNDEPLNFSQITLPLKVCAITVKGKCIILILAQPDSKVIYLTSQLGVGGQWTWEQEKHSDLWFEIVDKNLIHRILYYRDPRHQGQIRFFLSLESFENTINKAIGHDLLQHAINLQNSNIQVASPQDTLWPIWQSKIKNKRFKEDKMICIFLMEQNHFSGIGNYLRAEILYESRVSPFRTLRSLLDRDILFLYYFSLKIILDSYNCHGLTIATYWDLDGNIGTYPRKVYGKSHDPYGNIVEKYDDKSCKSLKDINDDDEEKKGRTIHWVPAIQI